MLSQAGFAYQEGKRVSGKPTGLKPGVVMKLYIPPFVLYFLKYERVASLLPSKRPLLYSQKRFN